MRTDAQQNRARLLETARTLAETGQRAPTLNELAREAGLGVATVYRHFPDQGSLLGALLAEEIVALTALMDRATRHEDPGEALACLFLDVLDMLLANPLVGALLQCPGSSAAPVVAHLNESAAAIVRRARRARAIRPDLDADDVCHLLQAVYGAGERDPRAARRYAEVVLAGMRAPS